jgi:hypothetical protein
MAGSRYDVTDRYNIGRLHFIGLAEPWRFASYKPTKKQNMTAEIKTQKRRGY